MPAYEGRGSAADGGGAPQGIGASSPGFVARLASVRLTLWLLAILGAAMAVATIVPQRAADEVYTRAFGVLIGPLIAQTTLRNVYGAWWFIGAFALLAVSLAACSLQRIARLVGSGRREQGELTQERVTACQRHTRWDGSRGIDETAAAAAEVLRERGYAIRAVPASSDGQRGMVGERGRLAAWAPVLVHVGVILVLVGAAYGRLPSNAYRAVANLEPGQSFPVETGDSGFSVRLLEAGSEHDAEGQPTRFWARAEVVEDGDVVKSATIEPNHPLRFQGVSVVLQSLPQARYAVEVSQDEVLGYVPVALTHGGAVDMMSTIRQLERPPWLVFIHDFRELDEGDPGTLAARVFLDESGELSHNWELVGWVDEEGLEYRGLNFRLVSAAQGAQLSLDRDIGVPVVWLGFAVAVLGALLLVSVRRSRMALLVRERRSGSQVLIGGSGSGVERDLEGTTVSLGTKLGRELNVEVAGKEEGRS